MRARVESRPRGVRDFPAGEMRPDKREEDAETARASGEREPEVCHGLQEPEIQRDAGLNLMSE